MSLGPEYLNYPQRSYGMDHERYTWSMLADRKPVNWPGDAKLALWINVSLQFFPLNQRGVPFPPPGGMTMPYPDLRHYTLRDYGNRVGIFRVLDALESRGHYGGLDRDSEQKQVFESLAALRSVSGQAVRGWLSPGRNESEHTPELLAEHGIEYLCDWVNDELPYPFHTDQGPLIALPLSTELEDRFVIQNNLHSEASWQEQVCDAGDLLLEEAETQGGRLLALSLHPWLIGQPHRIGKLEAVLDYLLAQKVWSASPSEIVSQWQAQQSA